MTGGSDLQARARKAVDDLMADGLEDPAFVIGDQAVRIAELEASLRKLKSSAEFLLVGIAARNRRAPHDLDRMRDMSGALVIDLQAAVSNARQLLYGVS